LRQEFTALLAGRDPATVVHHCGSGVSAVPNVLAMEIAGLGPTALYAGSWSEWCNTPGLPCAKGCNYSPCIPPPPRLTEPMPMANQRI
jgi:thiosulfate/3-mercaptopyruvate sulfurtransferase